MGKGNFGRKQIVSKDTKISRTAISAWKEHYVNRGRNVQ